jgi:hypothetical protein
MASANEKVVTGAVAFPSAVTGGVYRDASGGGRKKRTKR